MNGFERIPETGKVKNDSGVVVDFNHKFLKRRFDADLVNYEVNGEKYGVRAKLITNQNESYYEVDVSYVFREGARPLANPEEMPKELIEQIRENLPQAYAAIGQKCVIKEYPAEEFRLKADSMVVRNELGVKVQFTAGGRDGIGVIYVLDGVRYVMGADESQEGDGWTYAINLRHISTDGKFVPLPAGLLDRMREDLPKACAAFHGRKCILR